MRDTKTLIIVVVMGVLALAALQFFYEDPVAQVRDAHEELARLLSKPEGEVNAVALLNAQILQRMFADTCEITGQAERFAGSYTAEEITSIIMQVRQIFTSANLSFGDLEIEFPAEDQATTRFSARLIAQARTEEAIELREVVSRMRRIDGDWLFTAFDLTRVFEDQ